jgi:hypothetical protein
MPSPINLRLVKKIVIKVYFVPTARRVFGMTFTDDHANTFEDQWEHWNQELSSVGIPSKWFSSDSGRIRSISVDTST